MKKVDSNKKKSFIVNTNIHCGELTSSGKVCGNHNYKDTGMCFSHAKKNGLVDPKILEEMHNRRLATVREKRLKKASPLGEDVYNFLTSITPVINLDETYNVLSSLSSDNGMDDAVVAFALWDNSIPERRVPDTLEEVADILDVSTAELLHWRSLPKYRLSSANNSKMFFDNLTRFAMVGLAKKVAETGDPKKAQILLDYSEGVRKEYEKLKSAHEVNNMDSLVTKELGEKSGDGDTVGSQGSMVDENNLDAVNSQLPGVEDDISRVIGIYNAGNHGKIFDYDNRELLPEHKEGDGISTTRNSLAESFSLSGILGD